MIGNLTFDSICEMVINEARNKYPYIEIGDKAREDAKNMLTPEENEFYSISIPRTVVRGMRIKKYKNDPNLGPAELDAPISDSDSPFVRHYKELYKSRVDMYRTVLLNIKYLINNLPTNPSTGEQATGLKMNELFATSVSPQYKVTKLQMNQFKNFMSGLYKQTKMLTWDAATDEFVPGGTDVSEEPISQKVEDPLDNIDDARAEDLPDDVEVSVPDEDEDMWGGEPKYDDEGNIVDDSDDNGEGYGFISKKKRTSDDDEPEGYGTDIYKDMGLDDDYWES